MASAFNLEAVDIMAPAARLGGLRHACAFSGFTHDGEWVTVVTAEGFGNCSFQSFLAVNQYANTFWLAFINFNLQFFIQHVLVFGSFVVLSLLSSFLLYTFSRRAGNLRMVASDSIRFT